MWVPVKDFKAEVKAGDRLRLNLAEEAGSVGAVVVWFGEEFVVARSDVGAEYVYAILLDRFCVWREPRRWKPEDGGEYWVPGECFDAAPAAFRMVCNGDNLSIWHYSQHKCFRTEEQALECARREIEARMKYHEEIGE